MRCLTLLLLDQSSSNKFNFCCNSHPSVPSVHQWGTYILTLDSTFFTDLNSYLQWFPDTGNINRASLLISGNYFVSYSCNSIIKYVHMQQKTSQRTTCDLQVENSWFEYWPVSWIYTVTYYVTGECQRKFWSFVPRFSNIVIETAERFTWSVPCFSAQCFALSVLIASLGIAPVLEIQLTHHHDFCITCLL